MMKKLIQIVVVFSFFPSILQSQTPCSEEFGRSFFESVFPAYVDAGVGGHPDDIFSAFDITVQDGEDFQMNKLSINIALFTDDAVNNVEVRYYENSTSDNPGNQIGSETVTPTSFTTLGENFGFTFQRMVLDLTPFNFVGQEGSPTTYWIGLRLNNTEGGSLVSSGIEAAETDIAPNGFYSYVSTFSQAVGTWEYPFDLSTGTDALGEFIYNAEGTCQPTNLSVNEVESKNSMFNVYPNPASEKITIKNKSEEEVLNTVILDASGKVLFTYEGLLEEIDVSDLNSGVYILNLELSDTVISKKIVKK